MYLRKAGVQPLPANLQHPLREIKFFSAIYRPMIVKELSDDSSDDGASNEQIGHRFRSRQVMGSGPSLGADPRRPEITIGATLRLGPATPRSTPRDLNAGSRNFLLRFGHLAR